MALSGNGSTEAQTLIPYINAFEESLEENRGLLETLQSRVISLDGSMGDEGGDLKLKIESMVDALTGLFSSFKRLEETFEHSQSVASRSGKLIESIYKLRRQSQDAKELFLIFSDLAAGKGTNRLDAILDSASPETRSHGAKIMRRLRMLEEQNIEGAEEATKVIGELRVRYEDFMVHKMLLLGMKNSCWRNSTVHLKRTI